MSTSLTSYNIVLNDTVLARYGSESPLSPRFWIACINSYSW